MLFKSLEFKHQNGQKVKVIEIPVLDEGNSYYFMLAIKLQRFTSIISANNSPKKVYSFREYLKKVLKWPDYERLFKTDLLKNNA
ncbi:YpmP family protein [Bacillus timonensis]|nr:YpmP family protein [Bacillus timonensis]